MEQLHAHVNKATSYHLSFNINNYILVLFANVHETTLHEYGHDFRKTVCTLRQLYKFNHQRTNVSLANIVHQLTVVDSIRDRTNAPAPKSAHSVSESIEMLSNFMESFGTGRSMTKLRLVSPVPAATLPIAPRNLQNMTTLQTTIPIGAVVMGAANLGSRRHFSGRTIPANIEEIQILLPKPQYPCKDLLLEPKTESVFPKVCVQ